MRKPDYLSPTSVTKFFTNPDEFYLNYISDNRPPKIPQTQPMAIGAAFDAFIKSHLYEKIVKAKPDHVITPNDARYKRVNIFTNQVEAQNREWAQLNGAYAFQSYALSGAIADIVVELQLSTGVPRFEFEVRGELAGVPILGRPDLHYRVGETGVTRDWKVNGYCGKSNTSPKPGYCIVRDGWKGMQSRSHMTAHKNAVIQLFNGVRYNAAMAMEDVDEEWAMQLFIYAMCLGEKLYGEFIVGIDQLACDGSKRDANGYPQIRVATFRHKIKPEFQAKVVKAFTICWNAIQTGHIFYKLTRAESDARCLELDQRFSTKDDAVSFMNNELRAESGSSSYYAAKGFLSNI